MKLDEYVRYLRDALNRFQVRHERAGHTEDTFDMWWLRLHHYVRAERPKAKANTRAEVRPTPPGTRCDPTTTTRPRRGSKGT